jgi:anion-transporting  ArsA/GET3 family ATPase
VLRDVQTFVSALDTMFGGFRERADYTYQLLRAPGTAFLVVAAPEEDALREASYFVERLDTERMPLAGLILNRVQRVPAAHLSAARSLAAAEVLQGPVSGNNASGNTGAANSASRSTASGHKASGNSASGNTASRNTGANDEAAARQLTIAALQLHADRMTQAAAERRLASGFAAAHPLVPVAEIPAQPEDVHDLDGLRRIGESFAVEHRSARN